MANVLIVLPEQYLDGVVPLIRGDQWNIDFQLKNRIGGVDVAIDSSAASGCTAFFPGATGGAIPVVCVTLDAAQSLFRAVVIPSVTQGVGLVSSPTTWYIQITTTEGLQTFETPDMPLVINDAAFNS